ncbi:MAG: trypsin-like peptidase domain-containing protein [Bacteroidota bacterium]
MRKIISTFVIAALGGAFTLGAYKIVERKFSDRDTYFRNQAPVEFASYTGKGLAGENPDFRAAAAKTVHAVVHIKTTYEQKNSYYDQFFGYDPFFNFFRNPYGNGPIVAAGSGVIVSENGYIITNNHVVQDASTIEVTLNDKRTYEAKLVGADPNTDLALIKIEESNLPYIIYGNSDETQVGDWVLAVGNPFNLTSTVTAGIVSAKARDIDILGTKGAVESFIQTDAVVNPGNSGGALVNTNGELVGINAAIATNTGSYTGYSFAIPSNLVRKIVADLVEFGQVQQAFLGVSFVDMDSKFAKEKGFSEIKGVYVQTVNGGSAADDAGIKAGDLILKMGDITVNSESEFKEILARHRPGDKVPITILRDNKEEVKDVTLEGQDGTTAVSKKDPGTIINSLGATFENMSKEDLRELNINYGVRIAKLDKGKLWSAGVKEGFIITQIDNTDVKTIDDITKYLGGKKGGIMIQGIYPNGMMAYYAFGL